MVNLLYKITQIMKLLDDLDFQEEIIIKMNKTLCLFKILRKVN